MHGTGPELEEQLFNLSPKAKMLLGTVIGIAGSIACGVLWDYGWVAGGALFAGLLGPVLVLTGLREQARERAYDDEVERAKCKWHELEAGIQAARQNGESVARYLQAKGYREYGVRRWIAAELDPGTQAVAE